MKKIRLRIGGMSCSACSIGLEKHLNRHPKIMDATVHLVLQEAVIQYEDDFLLNEIETLIEEAGFQCLGEVQMQDLFQKKKMEKNNFCLLIILFVLVFYISMANMFDFPIFDFLDKNQYPVIYACFLLIFTIPFFYFGRDIFRNGWNHLIHKNPNMDTLIMMSVGVSFLYSILSFIFILLGNVSLIDNLYFDSVCMVIFFVKVGRYLDGSSKMKAVEAVQELVQMTPEVALRKVGKEEQEVTIDEVKVDDVLIVKPGMKIAVDGLILNGTAHLDESFITGEVLSVKKKKGDMVVVK